MMEALFIIGGTVLLLSLGLYLTRVNDYFFTLSQDTVQPKVATIDWMVSANHLAWWLALFGVILSAPLLILLAIDPSSDGWTWSFAPGLLGMVLIGVTAGLSIVVFIQQCIRHHLAIKKVLANLYQHRLKPAVQRYGAKVGLAIVAALLLSPLIPYLLELIKVTSYAAGLWLAGRLGLSDSNYNYTNGCPTGGVYNYATGELDDGCDIGGLYDD
jgi:hypothetical protein